MSSVSLLTRPVRRYLLERLERLHDALSRLGQRLREGLASVIGEHVGETVREAVHAALDRRLPDSRRLDTQPQVPSYRDPSYREPAYRQPSYPGYREDAETWDRDYGGHESAGLWNDRPVTVPPSPPPAPPKSRWWPLLPAALEAVRWWLHRGLFRKPTLTVLAVGATAGFIALVGGPLAVALAAAVGTALTLTGLADGVRNAIGGLAGATRGD
jgi:hypothetical protein